eukprot:141035-Chlamydomonas_euryale.AAC.15
MAIRLFVNQGFTRGGGLTRIVPQHGPSRASRRCVRRRRFGRRHALLADRCLSLSPTVVRRLRPVVWLFAGRCQFVGTRPVSRCCRRHAAASDSRPTRQGAPSACRVRPALGGRRGAAAQAQSAREQIRSARVRMLLQMQGRGGRA